VDERKDLMIVMKVCFSPTLLIVFLSLYSSCFSGEAFSRRVVWIVGARRGSVHLRRFTFFLRRQVSCTIGIVDFDVVEAFKPSSVRILHTQQSVWKTPKIR
jgi:hypothetical protein